MRAMLALLGAVMVGLTGGYGWSVMSRPAQHLHIPKGVVPTEPDLPQTPTDKAWAERSETSGRPAVDPVTPDPTAVEQSVYYAGCDQVRAAGKAPLHAGEPGYRPELDPDGDGIACEPGRGR